MAIALAAGALHGRQPVQAAGAPAVEAQSLETRAAAAFDRNDCSAALPLYQSALPPAEAARDFARLGLFYRRIGICYNRMGDSESALAAYRAGAAAAESAADIDLREENIHGAQLALQRLGRFSESLAEAQRELALAEQCRHPQHLVRALSAVANVNRSIGKTGLALQFYQRILDDSRAAHFDEGIHFALDNLAQMNTEIGDPETGLRYLRQVGQVPGMTGAVELVRYHNNLGDALEAMGRTGEALSEYRAALRYGEAPEAWLGRTVVLLNLGHLSQSTGHYAEARRYDEQCIELARQHKSPDVECGAEVQLSSCLAASADRAGAERAAGDAVAIARRMASPARLFESLGQLGMSLQAPAEARAALQEAVGVIETLRAAAPGDPQALASVQRKGFPVYQALVKNLLESGLEEEALHWAEQAKARVLDDVLRSAGIDEHRVMSAGEIRQENLLYRKVSEAAADRARAGIAIGELEFFRRQLYSKHPELSLQRADFAPAGPAQLKELLDSRTAMLDYFALPGGMALFVVRANGIQVARLAPDQTALAADVRRFRQQLAARDVNYPAAALALYGKLVAPAAAALRGTDQWVISPDGPLWDLPFQALMDGAGRHLLESHALSYAPSLTVLREIRRRQQDVPAAPLALLAMGNPAGSRTPLPEAEDEVRRIGALYPPSKSVVLTGVEARQDRFREQAPRAAVIHLATHAELNNFNPLYSYLTLAGASPGDDGMLPASEILRLPLHARLAVLSACETARGQVGRGEGLLGMGWALAGAGVPASVLSQWKVDSAATRTLMVAFHRELLAKSASPAAALQRAALEVSRQPGWRNPFYWAGFIVLGDGFR